MLKSFLDYEIEVNPTDLEVLRVYLKLALISSKGKKQNPILLD